jgi:hypothetical protein
MPLALSPSMDTKSKNELTRLGTEFISFTNSLATYISGHVS